MPVAWSSLSICAATKPIGTQLSYYSPQQSKAALQSHGHQVFYPALYSVGLITIRFLFVSARCASTFHDRGRLCTMFQLQRVGIECWLRMPNTAQENKGVATPVAHE